MQVSSLAVHTPSAATTLPLKTSSIHTLISKPGARHEDFLSSGAVLASKTELPGQICLEFVLTEGLCQAWEGSSGRLNFFGEKPWRTWWLFLPLCGMELMRLWDSKECTIMMWSWEQKPAVLWSISKCGKVTFLLLKFGWWNETLVNSLDIPLSVFHFHLQLLWEHWNHCNHCLKANILYGLVFLCFCNFNVQEHATVTVYCVWGEAVLCWRLVTWNFFTFFLVWNSSVKVV